MSVDSIQIGGRELSAWMRQPTVEDRESKRWMCSGRPRRMALASGTAVREGDVRLQPWHSPDGSGRHGPGWRQSRAVPPAGDACVGAWDGQGLEKV